MTEQKCGYSNPVLQEAIKNSPHRQAAHLRTLAQGLVGIDPQQAYRLQMEAMQIRADLYPPVIETPTQKSE